VADDLIVGGPRTGSTLTTSVVTTALVDESDRMLRLGGELGSCRRELGAIDRVIGEGILRAADAPRSALLAESEIAEAISALSRAIDHCALLARGLGSAAEGYEYADDLAARLAQDVAARFGHLIGSLAPLLLTVLLPGALVVGATWLGLALALPESRRAEVLASLGSWFRRNSAPLSDPAVVDAVRLGVMSADDAGWGLSRMPQGLASALGDEGLGIFGVDTSAAVVAALAAAVGLARETPVRVTVSSTGTTVAAQGGAAEGIRERVARIPEEPDQVRIDRYSAPGQPDRFEVYIAGTAELALSGDDEPWDMTSNLSAMGGGSSGSYRAVVEAMRLAGIDSDSAVTLTGYSQGGLIAAQLAASGDYAVDGLVTLGAPAGQVAVPHDIPYLAIEHTNDLVPALGGAFASSEPVVVRRQLFDGPPPPSEFALPAHRLTNYLDTARLVDASDNLRIAEVLHRLEHAPAESVTSTIFRAERIAGG
jgi:hypothetical protein